VSQARTLGAQTEALPYRMCPIGPYFPRCCCLDVITAAMIRAVALLRRRLVQIGEATHIVLLEKNRLQLYHEVQAFLDDCVDLRW
jgi:hypothetical protein